MERRRNGAALDLKRLANLLLREIAVVAKKDDKPFLLRQSSEPGA